MGEETVGKSVVWLGMMGLAKDDEKEGEK